MFIWTKRDSDSLFRLANAIEELAGKKTFIPVDKKLEISMVEESDEEEQEEARKAREVIREQLDKNEGNHLWEEENLPIIEEELF